MLDLKSVWALALAEMRLTRRLVRFWVFLVLGLFVAAFLFAQYTVLHRQFSAWSGTVSAINPRYLVAAVGSWFIYMFMLGLVFLAFDVRARDQRERMYEVLDSRPYSNLDLIFGRCLGQLTVGWLAMVFVCLLMMLAGFLLGTPIEPWSLVGLVFFMAVPAFTFTIALTYLVTLIVKYRLVAAVISIAALVGMFFAMIYMTLKHVAWFDVTGGYFMEFPSDLLPVIADLEGWLQRAGVMLIALGMLALAAALYPRVDHVGRPGKLGLGLAGLAAGALALGTVSLGRVSTAREIARWGDVHAEASVDQAPPDLQGVSGTVDIEPGDRIVAELELTLAAPSGLGLDRLLLTLNPGLEVSRIAHADGRPLDYTHVDGLLAVELPEPLMAGESMGVALGYAGVPDTSFAYLDAVIDIFDVQIREAQVFLLGYWSGYFERKFVALMPGTHWLPTPGAAVGRDVARFGERDPFELDLAVGIPDDWQLAGPGRSQPDDNGRRRFAPPAPLTEVALVGGPFEAREIEIEGTLFRVLLHPNHARQLDTLAPMVDELRTQLGEKLRAARDAGLPYPYGALSLVEVPVTLRGFGGGWRVESTLAPPGVLLVRENGFPTARFDVAFKNADRFKDREGGLPRAMYERVGKFFAYDFSGGNILDGAGSNFFEYQTAARGDDAVALEAFVDRLVGRLITGGRGYFSALLFDSSMRNTIGQVIGEVLGTRNEEDADFVEAMVRVNTDRGEVWKAALNKSLATLDPWESPKLAIDLLTLKGEPMAASVIETLGHAESSKLLARLLALRAGESYDRQDVIDAAGDRSAEVASMMSTWLDQIDLPGFVVQDSEAFRLSDADDGTPRYQLLVTIRNDEPVSGMLKLRYQTGSENNRRFDETEPYELGGRSAVRIGVVSSTPFGEVQVEPFLSLNRRAFSVLLAQIDEEDLVDAQPVSGMSAVEWEGPDPAIIIVDDLDAGFDVAKAEAAGLRRLREAGSAAADDGDELPDVRFGRPPSDWSRVANPATWGHYRHTAAVVMSSGKATSARFTAELDEAGRYRLEVFVPRKFAVGIPVPVDRGEWVVAVEDGRGESEETIDADKASPGWNLLGDFELQRGEVTVRVRSAESGKLLIADAVRWSPLSQSLGESR